LKNNWVIDLSRRHTQPKEKQMDYIDLEDKINHAFTRIKAIVNVLFYSQTTALNSITVPTLMCMAEDELNRLEVCIKELKAEVWKKHTKI
jgi:hypothetical protein